LNLHIQFGDHDAGGPFGKLLMHHLIEEEIQEIEYQTVAQVMDRKVMITHFTGLYQYQACCAPLVFPNVGSMVQHCLTCLT
jgi:hypothetical protein